MNTVVFLFVFIKNCSIIDYLGLKDSSHDLSTNCVISFFCLHLVLHACAARFDVTVYAQNFLESTQALMDDGREE